MHRITTAPKIRTNYKPKQAYLLQHSYSKAPVELEPKFGPRQTVHTTTQLLPHFSGARAKIWSNYTQDKPTYYNKHSYSKAPVELEPKFGQIIHKTNPTYYNKHSYSKAPVELEPKFGQIIHKTNPTYYNIATSRLQWS